MFIAYQITLQTGFPVARVRLAQLAGGELIRLPEAEYGKDRVSDQPGAWGSWMRWSWTMRPERAAKLLAPVITWPVRLGA